MPKRLLCIVPDDPAIPMFTCSAMPDWEILRVSALSDASRALRDNRFPVGLLLRLRSLQRSSDLDGFLRRHRARHYHSCMPVTDFTGRNRQKTTTQPLFS